jgi:hypothetical protein
MEWSTGELKPQEGETYYFLPDLKVHCCVKLPAKKAAEQSVQATGLRRCPACHALLEEHSVYCDTCGTDTPRA